MTWILRLGCWREDSGDLAQDRRAVRLQVGLAGVEQDAVQDVDGELALQLGDGDILGFEGGAHLVFQALVGLHDGLLFLLEVLDAGLALGELVLEVGGLGLRSWPRRPGPAASSARTCSTSRFFSQEAQPEQSPAASSHRQDRSR